MATETRDDFYQTLRSRIATWLKERGEGFRHAQVLLLAPDLFHLMCRLALDKRIPVAQKAQLAGAIAYFASPIDLVPEAIVGPIGYVDDVALAAYALNKLINAGHGAVAQEHWAGEGDLLSLIQQVLAVADEMIGSGLWERIRSSFDGTVGRTDRG
jgi:uncharacterized membrane protein YkvA (DUF1232 family)